jgi:hypothetical protein
MLIAEEEAFPSFLEMRDRLMSLILAAESHTTRRTPAEKYRTKRNPLGSRSSIPIGTTHIVFTPTSFLERLCALIPRPCKHKLSYHGVLARWCTNPMLSAPLPGLEPRLSA